MAFGNFEFDEVGKMGFRDFTVEHVEEISSVNNAILFVVHKNHLTKSFCPLSQRLGRATIKKLNTVPNSKDKACAE